MFSRYNIISSFHLPTNMIKLLVYSLIGFVCLTFGTLLVFRPDFLSTTTYRHAFKTGQHNYEDSEVEKILHPRNMTLIYRSVMERQRIRSERVRDVCAKLNATGRLMTKSRKAIPSHFSSFFVDDYHGVLYCSIPKVASTNWKRVLLVLTGMMNTTRANKLERKEVFEVLVPRFLSELKYYTMDAIEHRLETYYKFMFVRDPFERLLSAFVDRFHTTPVDLYRKTYGRQIVKQYRRHVSQESLRLGHDVTFEEFVSYLLDPRTKSKKPFNTHWKEYYQMCHPCFVNYDFIGKYETLRDDADFVLHQLGIREKVAFPTVDRPTVKTSEILAEKYSNISAADIYRLWKLYSIDFKLFDYPYPNFARKSNLT